MDAHLATTEHAIAALLQLAAAGNEVSAQSQ
jgi:hypothetical protein